MARTMRTYLSAEYSLETSRHEGLDLLEGAVDAMDIRGDKLKFMDMHSQIFCPPARFDYQPHMGDEVSHQSPESFAHRVHSGHSHVTSSTSLSRNLRCVK